MTDRTDKVARAICQEQCAFYGEPPCWTQDDLGWPHKGCDEPGCMALAQAAVKAMEDTGRVEALEGALAFYATSDFYISFEGEDSTITCDAGVKARAALGGSHE